MERSIVFATDVSAPLVEVARSAERAGFTRAWTTEYSWADAVDAVQAEFRRVGARWDDLAALVPDDMVDDLVAAGTPDVVNERLAAMEKRFAAHGATELVLQTVGVGLTDAEVVEHLHRMVRDCGPH